MAFSRTVIICASIISAVSAQALLCNFDSGSKGSLILPCTCDSTPCQLNHTTTGNYTWQTFQGATPTGPSGPTDDHTLQNGQGLYIYTEASSRKPGAMATIQTPELSLSTMSCFTFWYHMRGIHMGSLTVTASYRNGSTATLWEKTGAQNLDWTPEVISLPRNTLRLFMTSLRGGGDIGMPYADIGLDDLKIEEKLCPGVTTVTAPPTPTTTSTTTQPPITSSSMSTPTLTTPTTTTTTTTTTTIPPTSPSSSSSTSTSIPSSGQQELWGLDETLWIIILCVVGAVILILLVIVCVQACAMRRMRTARILRQSEDYSNIQAYNTDPALNKDTRDNYINAYDNMAVERDDKSGSHPNGGGLL